MAHYRFMIDSSLIFHEFADCLWIRCTSRGCFINSPSLKTIADHYLMQGGAHIVVDLELCPGVDSTFMGTLAGIARRCIAADGELAIASPTARTRAAMETLGLDFLVNIDPPEAAWQADIASRREVLAQDTTALEDQEQLSEVERTRHVLDAHNTLRAINKQNDAAFGYVCETLEEDLRRHNSGEDNAQA